MRWMVLPVAFKLATLAIVSKATRHSHWHESQTFHTTQALAVERQQLGAHLMGHSLSDLLSDAKGKRKELKAALNSGDRVEIKNATAELELLVHALHGEMQNTTANTINTTVKKSIHSLHLYLDHAIGLATAGDLSVAIGSGQGVVQMDDTEDTVSDCEDCSNETPKSPSMGLRGAGTEQATLMPNEDSMNLDIHPDLGQQVKNFYSHENVHQFVPEATLYDLTQ